jgi:hypothetical protein
VADEDGSRITGRPRAVSGAVSRDRPASGGQPGFPDRGSVPPGPDGRRRPRGLIALGVVVVLAAGAVSAWRAGVFSAAAPSGPGAAGTAVPITRTVTRQDLSATTPVSATLGFAGSYPVTGQGSGKLTWLPRAGQVIRQGQALYRVNNGSPVVLLYGRVPDWRALHEGLTGNDVSQLNHDLVRLGYASRGYVAWLGWDYYSWATKAGVQRLDEHLGVASPSGNLPLGRIVFRPAAMRVDRLTGSLGGPASGPVLTATSDRHVVTIPLDPSDQSDVRPGDAVSVALPAGLVTPGVVTSVGTVASTSRSGQGLSTTIPVQVELTHPRTAGTLDQAPVTVNITTERSRGPVLAVPVTALVAQANARGEYVVEVVGLRDTRHWVPVTPGIFDGADGLVQVTGALAPGQRVVVPSS